MSKNTDRGTSFETEIKRRLECSFHEATFEVKTSKGSGNQRHDGDIQVIRKEGLIKNLLYIDCKNYRSAAVPSLEQIHKASKQGDRLGFFISATVMKNKRQEDIVSMRYEDFENLVEAMARHSAVALQTKESVLNKI